jgi:hypothetical protein
LKINRLAALFHVETELSNGPGAGEEELGPFIRLKIDLKRMKAFVNYTYNYVRSFHH